MNKNTLLYTLLTKGVFAVFLLVSQTGLTQCPDITPVVPVDACDSYTLPAIAGTDLTGNEGYFTGSGGSGTQFFPGDVFPGSVTLFIYDILTPGCEDEEILTVVVDNTPPTITCPGSLSAFCSILEQPQYTDLVEFTFAGGTASDDINLDAASFIMVSEVFSGIFCSEMVTRTYQISDLCGHTATCTQDISISESVFPVAIGPPDLTVQCAADVPPFDVTVVLGFDNCTESPAINFVSDVDDGVGCPQTIVRTYSVADDCGNTVLVTQTIVVEDTVDPTATAPAPVTIECLDAYPPDVTLITDEADNCGAPVVAFVSDVSDGGICPQIITRTYSVSDGCGNQILLTQEITVADFTMPTASVPAPSLFACMADVPPADVNIVTDEADNCAANVAFVGEVSNGATCPVIITRTYSISDNCGNQIFVDHVITVDDNIDPTASNPAPIVVQCPGVIPPDVTVVTDEADNCSVPVVAFVNDVVSAGTCPQVITRTYSVTDDCGNQILVTQTITIDDTTPPTASNPAPLNVQCIAEAPVNIAAVTDEADNCGVPVVAFVSDVSDGGDCPAAEVITRTYSVTDVCGNQILVTQIITVLDITDPIAANPAPLAVQCTGAVPASDINVVTGESDNCTVNPVVAFVSDVSNGGICPEIITRTYSVTDDCGNQILVTQTITIDDTVNPTATAPAPVTVQCIGAVPAPNTALITDEADNCTVNPVVAFVGDVSNGGTCPEIITRTYSVTDNCGNQLLLTQTITVDDNINPTASNPAPIMVQCIAAIPPDITVVTDEVDNCTTNPVVAFVGDVSNGGTCPQIITRTYSVTDNCGNQILVTQLITVTDNIPPTASNPAPLTVQCIGDAPANPAVVIDEADNCAPPVVAFVSDVSNGGTCPEVITRTYSVTDACGNQILVTQVITVDDTTNPTATNPAPLAVQCIGLVPVPNPAVVTDEADNCSVPVVAFVSQVSDGGTCPEIITRTYSVTDACGNQILVTQTIVVDDTTNPTATAPAPVAVQCIGAVPAPNPALITDEADNCTVNPVVAFVGDVSNGGTCPEIITRTYSVTDNCGNQLLITQIITVDDTTNPTATAPAPIAVQCIADVPAPNPALITDEADNCTVSPVVAFVGDVSNSGTCPEIITRTYSVTDNCGNQLLITQTITVDDITNPTASNPAPITAQCILVVPPDPTVVIDEADNCTVNPVVAFVSDVSNGGSCPEVITRTYSVTDNCGNQILVTQTITVNDTTDPTASNPAPLAAQCVAPAPNPAVVIDEADNCAPPVVAFVSDVSNGGTCPEIITRTYSVTDACGNQIFVTQIITIDDTTNPTATNPAPIAVQCIGDVPAPNSAVVTDEADNCSVPVVAFVSDVSNGGTCPEIITRTYSVTDACGNQIFVTQTITVDDTTNPTATAPAPIAVQCIADVPAPNPLVITDEADNCTVNPVVAFVNDVSNGATCPETITRTYSVTDNCGNVFLVAQTIVVDDITNPTASNPGPLTAQCIAAIPPDPTVVTDEADNCSVPVVAFVSDVSNGASCPEIITRTYSVTDACGNQILVTQTITVNDTTDPTASNPAPLAAQCAAPAPNPLVVIDEADNCAVPVVAFVSDVSDGNTCPEVITRTYSVTDLCGNQILVTQIITINDTTDPTATNPAPIAVQCIGDVPAPNPAVVNDEADNCSVPVVVFVSDVSNGGTCPEIITRTYSVTDACGNQIMVTQTITVDDTTNPTATAPATITVQCAADVPVPDPTLIIDEADNCTVNPVVVFVSDVSDGNTCPETITRTYSVTDNCGNQLVIAQTILIDDTTLPTASNPAPLAAQCIAAVPPDITVVTDEADNCTAVPVVVFVSDVSDGNTCPEVITRTYSVTDDCGNQLLVTQQITINDNILPTASNPAPINAQCIAAVPPDVTVVTDEADNCALPVVAFVGDVSDGNTCPEVITRTYSVTDACGNQILVTQTITVNDDVNPTASNPIAINVQCAADVPTPDITVVTDEADNCTVNPVVTFVSDISDGNTCPELITRTYNVSDDCGNQILVAQVITVNDDTNPTASNPAAVNVQCTADVPAPDITVVTDEADNCTPAPLVAFVSDVSDGNTCPEIITRTYSITDDCGNQFLVAQIITVNDDVLPTASNPIAVSVQCGGDVPVPDITVVTDESDNCTTAPVVVFVSDVSDGNTCPEIITRTYSITDDCGNQLLVTQTISVGDDTDPTASNLPAINVQCIADVTAPDPTLVNDEADNCTVNPVVAFVSDVSDGGICPEIITRTYSITDDCANQLLVTQTITVFDNITPTASNPVAVNVQCAADVPAPDITVITDAADNCTAAPAVVFVSDVSDGNTCPEIITRAYSITDDCGNQLLVTQTITVNDDTNPIASNPIAVNVQCAADVPAPDVTVVTDEADNCTANPLVVFVNDLSDGNICPEVITRTYSVTDDCGNQILVTQTITVNDDVLPTASNPVAVNVQCAADVPAPDITVVNDEADNCTANPVVVFVNDLSDGNTCPELITRTYSVTDDCGNQLLVTQTITVNDDVLPTASNPVAVNVQCAADVPAPDITVVTDENDNCTTAPVVVFVSDLSDGNTCPEIITRTYSVTDDCGNELLVTQTITVLDDIDPVGVAPADADILCSDVFPVADIASVTGVSDNCSPAPVVVHVGDVSDGNTCPETITRTYRITDDCGNSIDLVQTLTIFDDVVPTASNPLPVNVQCIGDVPAADITVVTDEADNCTTNPVVAFVNEVSNGNTCPEIITRTYSITDDCGNQILVTQVITVDDNIAPTATNPADVIVASAADIPAPDVTIVNDEADNCTPNPVVSFVSDVSDGNICNNEIITRTYSVTDDCGNVTLVTQLIRITALYPEVNFTVNDPAGCPPQTLVFENLSTPAGVDCFWTFGDGSTLSGCGSVEYTYTENGLFDVSLTVTTAEGCTATETYNDFIFMEDGPIAAFTYEPDVLSITDTEVAFYNESLFADSYEWDFGYNTPVSNAENPTHLFPVVGNVSYLVTLVASNSSGCTDTAQHIIHVNDVLIFYVPNAFTPDGDDYNQVFFPVFTSGYDIYDYHLTIFDRWGEIIFESYNAEYGWDGTYGNNGLVQDGVYVWQIDFGDTISDERHIYRGHITVLK